MPPKKSGYSKEALEIMQLSKTGDNKECAECGAPCPLWVSYTLGVFICTRCAGLHRSLGVHLSRVKSITLDLWTSEIVESMKKMGNKVSKNYFESTLPDQYPRPKDDRTLIEFIRNKYEHKAYAPKTQTYAEFISNRNPPTETPQQDITKQSFVPESKHEIPPKDELEEIFSSPVSDRVPQNEIQPSQFADIFASVQTQSNPASNYQSPQIQSTNFAPNAFGAYPQAPMQPPHFQPNYQNFAAPQNVYSPPQNYYAFQQPPTYSPVGFTAGYQFNPNPPNQMQFGQTQFNQPPANQFSSEQKSSSFGTPDYLIDFYADETPKPKADKDLFADLADFSLPK